MEKNSGKASLAGLFLGLAIVIIIAMGYFMVNILNEQKTQNEKVAELTAQLSQSQEEKEKLQEKVDEIEKILTKEEDEVEEKINEKKEDDYNLIGKWSPISATLNGEEVSLQQIWGSSIKYGGYLIFNEDGTYSRFIGAYSTEEEDALSGKYKVENNKIIFTTNSGKKETATIENDNIIYDLGYENYLVTFKK